MIPNVVEVVTVLSNSFPHFMAIVESLPPISSVFRPSFCQSVCFWIIWCHRQRGLLEYLSLYASYRLFDSLVRPEMYSV